MKPEKVTISGLIKGQIDIFISFYAYLRLMNRISLLKCGLLNKKQLKDIVQPKRGGYRGVPFDSS